METYSYLYLQLYREARETRQVSAERQVLPLEQNRACAVYWGRTSAERADP